MIHCLVAQGNFTPRPSQNRALTYRFTRLLPAIRLNPHSLKPTHKRSNLTVFFDYECATVLKRWLKKRTNIAKRKCEALFVSYNSGGRLERHAIYETFTAIAEKAGLHNPISNRMEEHFTPHCCRHWFTTHLRRNGMPREFIKELRGDKRTDSMDVYYHIDVEELRKSYLACIPQLGII